MEFLSWDAFKMPPYRNKLVQAQVLNTIRTRICVPIWDQVHRQVDIVVEETVHEVIYR